MDTVWVVCDMGSNLGRTRVYNSTGVLNVQIVRVGFTGRTSRMYTFVTVGYIIHIFQMFARNSRSNGERRAYAGTM